jgi:hypothetical protein
MPQRSDKERNENPNFQENEPGYWSERAYGRHPKKRNLCLVQAWYAHHPSAPFAEIDRVHALWCETQDWQQHNAKFAPKLDEWLMDRGWTREPDHTRQAKLKSGEGDNW